MWIQKKLALPWLILSTCLPSIAFSTGATAGDVTIELKTGPLSVTNKLISIGDVANVVGPNESSVNRILKLDLEYLEDSLPTTITWQQIQMRVLVDRTIAGTVGFSGPEFVTVALSEKSKIRESVESALTNAFAKQFAIAAEDVRARLLNSNSNATLSAIAQSIDSVWFVFPTTLPYGSSKIKAEYTDGEGDVSIAELQCSFTILMDLVVAKGQLKRGTVISSKHVARVKRPINEPKLVPVSYKDCIGMTVATDIPIHSIVRASHVESRRGDTLVRRNDRVDVLIRKPGFQMRLKNAKALSSGSRNDTIQILNTNSNRKLSGVVVEKGLVEVR